MVWSKQTFESIYVPKEPKLPDYMNMLVDKFGDSVDVTERA